MIRLYAFVTGLRGVLPESLETVELGAIVAVVGPDVDEPASQGLAVQALLDVADAVLPARYGEAFEDVEALAEAVAPRLPQLAELLACVDGCVELVVRAARPEGDVDTGREDGGAYLRSRLRRFKADEAAAQALRALLEPRARRTVIGETMLSGLVHDGCYLVERPSVDGFAACVRDYAAAHPELSLVCTGPWAPATFSEAA